MGTVHNLTSSSACTWRNPTIGFGRSMPVGSAPHAEGPGDTPGERSFVSLAGPMARSSRPHRSPCHRRVNHRRLPSLVGRKRPLTDAIAAEQGPQADFVRQTRHMARPPPEGGGMRSQLPQTRYSDSLQMPDRAFDGYTPA